MSDQEPTLQSDEGLGPPQFSLGHLLLLITGSGVVFASYQLMGSGGAFLILLFILAIVAHVIGNSLGTKLRDLGNEAPSGEQTGLKRRGEVRDSDMAPTTTLHEAYSLGTALLVCSVFGASLGAVIGLIVFVWLSWESATWSGSSMGIAAFAFLGGFFGFLLSGLFQAGSDAIQQAVEDEGHSSQE